MAALASFAPCSFVAIWTLFKIVKMPPTLCLSGAVKSSFSFQSSRAISWRLISRRFTVAVAFRFIAAAAAGNLAKNLMLHFRKSRWFCS